MAYADQEMSGNKIVALIVVALLHVFIGYAFISGLAYQVYEQAKEEITTIEITEEEPEPEPEEPPPPPEKQDVVPPPVVTPPPIVRTPPQVRPPVQQVQTPPPASPPTPVAAPPRPVPPPAPPPPPPPSRPAQAAEPRGNPGRWVTPNDYPPSAKRAELEGTTGFKLTIDTDGRVSNCQITRSSGHSSLDDKACEQLRRRARFKAAEDSSGNKVTGTYSNAVRWELDR